MSQNQTCPSCGVVLKCAGLYSRGLIDGPHTCRVTCWQCDHVFEAPSNAILYDGRPAPGTVQVSALVG